MQEVFEKIIEKLEENQTIVFNLGGGKPKQSIDLERAIEIIKQTAAEYNNGWISCNERLPEPIRPVLVTLRNWMNDKYFVRVGRFHTDHWKTDEGIVENSVVVAWQPLPQPYQSKGE